MNVEQVTAFLRITPHTLRILVREYRIVGRKVGREYRFYRPALIAWLTQGGDPGPMVA